MKPETLLELIQEMRSKKAMFAQFARFVNFNFEHSKTVFKTELIRSYAAFIDALDAAIDDYNEAENATPKLLYTGEFTKEETVIANGKLAPKERGEYGPAPEEAEADQVRQWLDPLTKLDPPTPEKGWGS
jgi:hypothetical protein